MCPVQLYILNQDEDEVEKQGLLLDGKKSSENLEGI